MDSGKHVSKSAILFKLSQDMLNDLKKASAGKDGVQFVAGKAPVRLLFMLLCSHTRLTICSRNSA